MKWKTLLVKAPAVGCYLAVEDGILMHSPMLRGGQPDSGSYGDVDITACSPSVLVEADIKLGTNYANTWPSEKLCAGCAYRAGSRACQAKHERFYEKKPMTCQAAAAQFREWADKASYEQERLRHDARAEVLEAFGDAPLPAALVKEWGLQ